MEGVKVYCGAPPPMFAAMFADADTDAISAEQREVNRRLGISDEIFLKHRGKGARRAASAATGRIAAEQREVNKAMGIDDATFLKYYPAG